MVFENFHAIYLGVSSDMLNSLKHFDEQRKFWMKVTKFANVR